MADFFFYGTLCHAPLLHAVLGHEALAEPARIAGYRAVWAEGQSFPVLVPDPDGAAEGRLVRGLSEDDAARIVYYEGGFVPVARGVMTASGPVEALTFDADPGLWAAGADWDLADWTLTWGPTVVAAAEDFMRLRGQRPTDEVAGRYHAMLVRAASTVRAQTPAPAQVRRRAENGDVTVAAFRQPYAKFFAIEEYDLSFRRFDGAMSPVVTRAAFISGDAAVVLPYDPVRDRVLLVEQFRAGPLARGDREAWMLEPIAGRVDPGESPADCAMREAVEEAGLTLERLVAGPSFYPSPGAKSEYLYTFLGIADLPDDAAGIGGVPEEAEDIRGHLLSFAELMALVESGEAENGPLLVMALWLGRERARLRAAAGA